VQIREHAEWAEQAQKQQQREYDLVPPRGTIYDRKGRELAVSMTVYSAAARPRDMDDIEASSKAIAAVLGMDAQALQQRLAEGKWSWVSRQLDHEVAQKLKTLELPGLDFVEESKRFYPLETLAGPLLGFVGTDHVGLAGLEAEYDRTVAGKTVRRTLLMDALAGRLVAPGHSVLDPDPGADLHLTIDASIQHIVERELARAVEEHNASGAMAVFMDPYSGAIQAIASVPSFDPNRFRDYAPERWRNRVVQDAYEPGSTFKLVTAAAALESNVVDPMDVIDCEMGAIILGRTRIRDHKSFDLLSFREVFSRSSNVGAIKVGLRVGQEALSRQIRTFGFGERTGVDLPGESPGIVRPVERWTRHEVAYASIGQGISITPLQLVRAFAAVANGGYLLEPYVVAKVGGADNQPAPERRRPILSPPTIRTLLRLLEAVVEEGTGRLAAVPGYTVAGKTGTAQKAVPGRGYAANRFVASFAGFVPSRHPRLVGLVVVDEPRGMIHGGEVAAPVFSAVLRQVLPLLGVPPDRRSDIGISLARRTTPPEGKSASALPSARARGTLEGDGSLSGQLPSPGLGGGEVGSSGEAWVAAGSE
jgi:cell division protein FtsI (penicillin-binding protein 3)